MNRELGLLGEELAVRYLLEEGYFILERNYRTKLGELDIIAKKENILIFIEVKTRTSSKFGIPAEAVDYRKQQRIIRLCNQYIVNKKTDMNKFNYRIDVIEVIIREKKYKINHIENAF